jgi:hypothetical protein
VRDVLQTAYYMTFCVVLLAASLFPTQKISIISLVVLLVGLTL